MGHTKLAALRHVHHLQVIFPPLNNGIYHDNSHMSQEDRKNAFLSKKEEVERSIRAAEEKMKALAIGSMPNIEKVQIGEKLYQYESHPDDRAAELVKLLIGRVNPRVWCQYHDWRISSPVNDIAGDNVLLPILHRHIRTFDSFSIVLGSTNHIYIHREPLTIRQRAKPRLMIAERTCGYRAPKPYNLGDLSRWLERRIIDSLSVHGLDLDPRTQTIIDNTRIIIGGAAPQTGLRLLEGDQVDEFEGSKAIIKEIKKGLVNRGRKDLAGLQIQAEQARDMLPCPVCGAGLGGIVSLHFLKLTDFHRLIPSDHTLKVSSQSRVRQRATPRLTRKGIGYSTLTILSHGRRTRFFRCTFFSEQFDTRCTCTSIDVDPYYDKLLLCRVEIAYQQFKYKGSTY